MQRQPTKWEKIIANHVSEKIFANHVSTIQNILRITTTKITQLKQWEKDLNRHISPEKIYRWPTNT